jgi:hypothetical protein
MVAASEEAARREDEEEGWEAPTRAAAMAAARMGSAQLALVTATYCDTVLVAPELHHSAELWELVEAASRLLRLQAELPVVHAECGYGDAGEQEEESGEEGEAGGIPAGELVAFLDACCRHVLRGEESVTDEETAAVQREMEATVVRAMCEAALGDGTRRAALRLCKHLGLEETFPSAEGRAFDQWEEELAEDSLHLHARRPSLAPPGAGGGGGGGGSAFDSVTTTALAAFAGEAYSRPQEYLAMFVSVMGAEGNWLRSAQVRGGCCLPCLLALPALPALPAPPALPALRLPRPSRTPLLPVPTRALTALSNGSCPSCHALAPPPAPRHSRSSPLARAGGRRRRPCPRPLPDRPPAGCSASAPPPCHQVEELDQLVDAVMAVDEVSGGPPVAKGKVVKGKVVKGKKGKVIKASAVVEMTSMRGGSVSKGSEGLMAAISSPVRQPVSLQAFVTKVGSSPGCR